MSESPKPFRYVILTKQNNQLFFVYIKCNVRVLYFIYISAKESILKKLWKIFFIVPKSFLSFKFLYIDRPFSSAGHCWIYRRSQYKIKPNIYVVTKFLN